MKEQEDTRAASNSMGHNTKFLPYESAAALGEVLRELLGSLFFEVFNIWLDRTLGNVIIDNGGINTNHTAPVTLAVDC